LHTWGLARPFTRKFAATLAGLALGVFASAASAWDADGHRIVGSVADQLLNPNAKSQVSQILVVDLSTAGPWLDCVKSVERDASGQFQYVENPAFEPPCTPFKTERDRMIDYVERNWSACSYKTGTKERGCHNTYHFVDVAIQRDRFDRNFQGTNDHDLVAAINAAIAVLLDRPAPPPFSVKDKREALFMLAHFIGDIGQPLHVGSVYLDKNGDHVDPDVTHTVDPSTETAGGNRLRDDGTSLHSIWDHAPDDLGSASTPALLAMAKAYPGDKGRVENWSYVWATDTLQVAQLAFMGLRFKGDGALKWNVIYSDKAAYLRATDTIKRAQLAKSGARLAALFNAIWP
jgi:hypothetical protein